MIEAAAPIAELVVKYGPGVIFGLGGVSWGLLQRADLAKRESGWLKEKAATAKDWAEEKAALVAERKELADRLERIAERHAAAMEPLTRQIAVAAGFIDSLRVQLVAAVAR